MSDSNYVIKTEEEPTALRRDLQAQYANPTCAVKARCMKGAALPIIKVEDTSDTDTASTITGSDSTRGSRKRRRDASEDESEQKPSKRRLSKQETVQLEEEEVLQSLLEGCDELESSLEVKVEPVPLISLTLRDACGATQRTRERAPSPPESATQVEGKFLPVTPPWSPEANQVADGDGENGVLVGGRLLRITLERRKRLGLPPLEVQVAPRAVAAARKHATATRRKQATGRKRATK